MEIHKDIFAIVFAVLLCSCPLICQLNHQIVCFSSCSDFDLLRIFFHTQNFITKLEICNKSTIQHFLFTATCQQSYWSLYISQLWLTSHPKNTVVLLDTETPGTSRKITVNFSAVPVVPVSSRTTVVFGWEVKHNWKIINIQCNAPT